MRQRHFRLLVMLLSMVGVVALALTWHPDLFIERTSSMTPLLKPGDLILGERLRPGQAPAVGQIAGYQYGGMLVTHRVIAANPNGTYIFKGDANPTADPLPVRSGQIHEVVIASIPMAGAVLRALTSPLGISLIALLIVGAGALLAWHHQRRQQAPRPTATLLEFPRRDWADERRAA